MHFVLELLFNAVVILILSRVMSSSVYLKGYGTAIGVALFVAVLNATVGAIIRFPLNLVTFFLLSFLVRLFVTAIMIKIADAFFRGFEVRTFGTALIMSLVLAIAGALFSYIIR